MSEKRLEILAGTRGKIFLLYNKVGDVHSKLGDLLARCDNLYKVEENSMREMNTINSTRVELIEESKKIFSELENTDLSIYDLPQDNFLLNEKSNQLAFHRQFDETENKSTDENQDENKARISNNDPLILAENGTIDESLNIAAYLVDLELPAAIFVCLKATAPAKQSIKHISDLLINRGFELAPRQLYEKIRSRLRHYEKSGIFVKDGTVWGIAEQYRDREPTDVFGKTETNEINRKESEKQNSQMKGGKTVTEYSQEIIEKSAQPWLHVDQLLIILEKDHGVVRSKANVASVLRKNAKRKRIFKSFGRNRFGLLSYSGAVKEASA